MTPDHDRDPSHEFAALHRGPRILLLPNAWDAASARLFEQEGFPAIATTSAGVAYSLGYPDGERAPFAGVREAIARIARAVSVPVTADLEAGHGRTPEEVGARCREVLEAGAVGINLEDGTGDPENPLAELSIQRGKIAAAREARAGGHGLFVNARTDVYLDRVGPPETWFDQAVERARAYLAAGADGVFVPGVRDRETIRRLAAAIDAPLNVLAGKGTPPAGELQELGVARVSVGSGPILATFGLLRRIVREIRDQGTWTAMTEDAVTYAEANRLFERPDDRAG